MNLFSTMRRPIVVLLATILLFSLSGIQSASGQGETVTLHIFKYWDAEPDRYTLTYDLNGGDGSPPPAQIGFAGTTVVVTEDIPVRDGFTFEGWSLVPDGPVDYSSGDSIVMDSDKTLYAVWTSIGPMFIVTLHPNPRPEFSELITEPIEYPVSPNTNFVFPSGRDIWPEPSGWVFSTWNTQADGLGVTYNATQTYLVTRDIDFYAQWSRRLSP